MTKIEKIVPHIIGQKKALERIKQLLPQLKKKYKDKIKNLKEAWESNSCTFSFDYKVAFFLTEHLSGEIIVEEDKVTVKGKGSDLIGPFKKKIEDIIEEEGKKLLKEEDAGDQLIA